MAKKSPEPSKPSKGRLKKLLTARVDVVQKGKLARDVKAPRWLRAFGGYFKGSWQELKQVRWPNRRATWSLTLAVILFTTFFIALILALDYGFEQLFKQVIL